MTGGHDRSGLLSAYFGVRCSLFGVHSPASGIWNLVSSILSPSFIVH
ncbi:MAG: hypothetical protein KAT07_10970 [Calditrichia bacterium]|nr:hypothetical protein [Calditrichia bacterium]